jgi:hypothetical protein
VLTSPMYLVKLTNQIDDIKARVLDLNFVLKGASLFNRKKEAEENTNDEYK